MKSKTTILVIVISVILSGMIFFGNKYYQKYLNDQADVIIMKNASIEDIDLESKKINIYVFWGDGCPHCEELFQFLESIRSKYGKYYNVYGFEVWYDEENGELMDKFKEEFGETPGSRGVPYFIVGDESFVGYQRNINREIRKTIVSKYKNRKKVKKFEDIFNKKEEEEINK